MVNYLWDNLFNKNQSTQDIVSQLNQCYLFNTLSAKELVMLEKIVSVRSYQPGEHVFRQGEAGIGMYLILEGCVDVYVDETSSTENYEAISEPVFVTRLKKGDFFGELSLVEDNSRRTATAIASTEVKLICFFKANLTEITERSPVTGARILYRLSEVLGRRLKETSIKITELKKQLEKLRKG